MDGSMGGAAPDAPDPPHTAGRVLSRRALLISAGALVLAGAGGVTAATMAPLHHRDVPSPPASLLAARDAEEALLAGIDAAQDDVKTDAATHALLAQLRADHVEHRRVLTAMIGVAVGRSYAPSGTPSIRTPPRSRAALRAAERAAARDGAARAAQLRGEQAALLASIAACETSHADLLG